MPKFEGGLDLWASTFDLRSETFDSGHQRAKVEGRRRLRVPGFEGRSSTFDLQCTKVKGGFDFLSAIFDLRLRPSACEGRRSKKASSFGLRSWILDLQHAPNLDECPDASPCPFALATHRTSLFRRSLHNQVNDRNLQAHTQHAHHSPAC